MRASEATPPLVTAFFAITGILTFVSGYFVLRAAWDLKSWGVAVTGLLMIPPLGFSLLWAAKLFLVEHQINPLRGYFKNPNNYDFAAWVELQDRLPFKAKVIYEIAVPAHCSLVGIEFPPQLH
jgi:uncharacterized membrane protein